MTDSSGHGFEARVSLRCWKNSQSVHGYPLRKQSSPVYRRWLLQDSRAAWWLLQGDWRAGSGAVSLGLVEPVAACLVGERRE